MILNVPLIRQPKDSKECGIAGLAMILSYYGLDKSFDDLKSVINVDEIGTYAPQLGSYLIKNGLYTEIITMHPKLFTFKDKGMDNKEILNHFQNLYPNLKSEQDKKVLEYFIEFLNNNGRINVKIPSKEDIIEEINNKRPICALLTSNFLLGDKPIFNFHFNVITGIDNEFIYVNDPLWDNRGGRHKYLISDFFFGLYASILGDLDNGCLIKIKR